MKKHLITILIAWMCIPVFAQNRQHTEKFEQLEYELRDPNRFRTASGAPGPEYWQNTADYEMKIVLNDNDQSITGKETITYTNNSPDPLNYVWVQLDQNVRAKDSDTRKTEQSIIRPSMHPYFMRNIFDQKFEGGFKIAAVSDTAGNSLSYTINKTMMVIDLPETMKTGDSFTFNINWSYNINDRMKDGGRSGFEYFRADDNYVYTIAQFFPRMCVYDDINGWQNKQFLGSGEFALPFGDYKVSITVPSDHILGATGVLQNREEVLTESQLARYEEAKTASEPVMIVNQAEAENAEGGRATSTKTWVFEAENVRDFAFASSRKFIWDAMGVDISGKIVMAESLYPKEGNPLWEEYSTRVVAKTLEVYSKYTFDYPYHKAISVHADRIGMEYPMICFNFGRPNRDGSYSDGVKHGMIGVIIHEVGHNFFPMIVNSDERQWTWMDEGLNTFMETLTELEWDPDFPADPAKPENITNYMRLDKSILSPIMTNSEQVQNLGPNAYSKPATALIILRNTIMGPELFDRAFKEYSQRWMFKHPTPADFFRTMEDASGVDLDWFWRGWFYTVDHVDQSLSAVSRYKMSTEKITEPEEEVPVVEDTTSKKKKKKKKDKEVVVEKVPEPPKKDYEEFYYPFYNPQDGISLDMNYYELTIENVGELVMPVILGFKFKDGSTKEVRIPAEIWRRNDQSITKVFAMEKEVDQILLDPNKEIADTDYSNNVWPAQTEKSRFESFKEQIKQ